MRPKNINVDLRDTAHARMRARLGDLYVDDPERVATKRMLDRSLHAEHHPPRPETEIRAVTTTFQGRIKCISEAAAENEGCVEYLRDADYVICVVGDEQSGLPEPGWAAGVAEYASRVRNGSKDWPLIRRKSAESVDADSTDEEPAALLEIES